MWRFDFQAVKPGIVFSLFNEPRHAEAKKKPSHLLNNHDTVIFLIKPDVNYMLLDQGWAIHFCKASHKKPEGLQFAQVCVRQTWLTAV